MNELPDGANFDKMLTNLEPPRGMPPTIPARAVAKEKTRVSAGETESGDTEAILADEFRFQLAPVDEIEPKAGAAVL